MNFTPAQWEAIKADGNVLVLAGAGAGKTSTLVERCVSRLLATAGECSLDQILMVTFTEAAAAEMRHRIRERLTLELSGNPPRELAARLERELALLDTARIGTLHSFCAQLIRQHFHQLDLDPEMAILPDDQAQLLREEALDTVLDRHYAGAAETANAVQELLRVQAGGNERYLRDRVLKIHAYSQTLPSPAAWFAEQLGLYRSEDCSLWREWFENGFRDWCQFWLPVLEDAAVENARARSVATQLATVPGKPSPAEIADALESIVEAANAQSPSRGKGNKLPKEFERQAAFLRSLSGADSGHPLQEDWSWVRGQMTTLLELAVDFGREYLAAKQAQAGLDFHDLEQYALRLLWDHEAGRPTPLARRWQERLRLVFVDEYQDINAAQDAILKALSRPDKEGNRFLVGDAKQSIYRFRLANPHIFQSYQDMWSAADSDGTVLNLSENFRSRQSLLHFINPLFADLMRREVGGLAYEQSAWLQFGDAETRTALAAPAGQHGSPAVEVHLQLTHPAASDSRQQADSETAPEDEEQGELADLTRAEQEARLVAQRLRELREAGTPVWDRRLDTFRPVEWRDMAILLRAPANKADIYAKEFARAGVPLEAGNGGFLECTEVSDLLSLLMLLDNPLQDVPVLAVLRSPLVGLTLDELAEIRVFSRHGPFWRAVKRWHELQSAAGGSAPGGELFQKMDRFLKAFGRWRRMGRQASLSQRLETILQETCYLDWLLAQPRGKHRRENVRRLLALTHQFDPLQRQGLPRFLRFIEARREFSAGAESGVGGEQDAVQLVSIHRSKGLEYPVVVLADLGKRFNFLDLRERVVLDDVYGLCPQIQAPGTARFYPSLPHWLACRRQKAEALGEELRLLYVAMTRARDYLLLVGTGSAKAALEKWSVTGSSRPQPHHLLSATSCLDWLGPWWSQQIGRGNWVEETRGRGHWFEWRIHKTAGAPGEIAEESIAPPLSVVQNEGAEEKLARLKERIEWQYSAEAATRAPAKTSATALRAKAEDRDEDQVLLLFSERNVSTWPSSAAGKLADGALSPAALGIAYHAFLQHLCLENAGDIASLRAEAMRLQANHILEPQQIEALDLSVVAAFWKSSIGRKILEHRSYLQREVPFTARFSGEALASLGLLESSADLTGEFLVVQGVADLVVLMPEEIWLLDFKTDRCKAAELDQKVQKYQPQLVIYASALARIYRRPVTQCWLHFLTVAKTVSLTSIGGPAR